MFNINIDVLCRYRAVYRLADSEKYHKFNWLNIRNKIKISLQAYKPRFSTFALHNQKQSFSHSNTNTYYISIYLLYINFKIYIRMKNINIKHQKRAICSTILFLNAHWISPRKPFIHSFNCNRVWLKNNAIQMTRTTRKYE